MAVKNPIDYQSQNEVEISGAIDIRRYLSLIWRWAWLIILVAIVAGIGSFLISNRLTPEYETKTKLLIVEAAAGQTADYQEVLASERRTRTYSDLLQNDSILQEVIDTLSLDTSIEKLRKEIEVSPVRDTQLIELIVEGEDPELIAHIANTLVSTFINRIDSIQAERYASSIDSLANQLVDIEGILADIKTQLEALDVITETPSPETEAENSTANAAQRDNLEAQELQYQRIYADLLTNYEQARLAETNSSANIIQVNIAQIPREPVRPDLVLNTTAAVVLSIFLTIIVVFVINIFEDTLNTPEEIERHFNLPVLGIIFDHDMNSEIISQVDPLSPVAEAFRSLRTHLDFCCVDEGIHTLLVTSPTMGSGKTLISTNLADMQAQSGKKIILVDVDLRRPAIQKKLALPNEKGLTTALLNPDLSLEKLFYKTPNKNLKALTSGALPPNPSELLGSERMRKVIEELKKKADMVIFDSTPVLPVADAVLMSTLVDGVLIVLEPGVTTFTAARLTMQALRRVNAKILGAVLNKVKMRGSSYSNYYRQYYGSY